MSRRSCWPPWSTWRARGAGPNVGTACPLLERSDDELEIIGYKLSNPLQASVACALGSCCRNLRRVMKLPLEALRPRHAEARALAAKVGMPCAVILELDRLDWRNKGLTAGDMATLSMLLATGALPRTEVLLLDCNRFGPAGARALCGPLVRNTAPHLTRLALHGNHLGDEGGEAVAAALDRGALPKLEAIWLGFNQMGDQGLAALAAPLRRRPALKQLWLGQNRIGDASVAALVSNLGATELKNLQWLGLADNSLDDTGCATLTAALDGAELPALKLWCNDNPVFHNPASDAARQAVIDAVRANVTRAP